MKEKKTWRKKEVTLFLSNFLNIKSASFPSARYSLSIFFVLFLNALSGVGARAEGMREQLIDGKSVLLLLILLLLILLLLLLILLLLLLLLFDANP